jgi:hypothetical protein
MGVLNMRKTRTVNEGRETAEATMISHRRFSEGTLRYNGCTGNNPTDDPAYCQENPAEVLKAVASLYHIERYKDIQRPFGGIPYDSGGLKIDGAKTPSGCSITGSLEGLSDFLDLPYNLGILGGSYSTWDTSARRKESEKMDSLRTAFNNKIKKDYGLQAFEKGRRDSEYNAIKSWMDRDSHLWEELRTKPIEFELHKGNEDLYSRLENFLWKLGEKHYPVWEGGFSKLIRVYNFLDEERFREVVQEEIKHEGLDQEDNQI